MPLPLRPIPGGSGEFALAKAGQTGCVLGTAGPRYHEYRFTPGSSVGSTADLQPGSYPDLPVRPRPGVKVGAFTIFHRALYAVRGVPQCLSTGGPGGGPQATVFPTPEDSAWTAQVQESGSSFFSSPHSEKEINLLTYSYTLVRGYFLTPYKGIL